MAVIVKTYNQILGDILRKIKADTVISDFHEGSVMLTLAEAIAENDFVNASSILSVLQQFNIDAVSNDDLDKRAFDYGIKRRSSITSNGHVTIIDTSITKRITGLYPLKLPPIEGSSEIHVLDASGWDPAGGALYIGRGTPNYEGPILYSSITNNISYYTITLNSSLQMDHLLSESVIDAQGTTDRFIMQGTEVFVQASTQKPKLSYYTMGDQVLYSGEDRIENVPVRAVASGDIYNTGSNTITNFSSLPFPGAEVSNPNPLVDGRDPESDQELRNRVKNIQNILSNGTADAILNEIIGITDEEDNKQVVSAKIQDSANLYDIARLYIDDSTGFSPSFSGQPVDTLLQDATGYEEFLQLSNYPLTRPQVISTAEAPFVLKNGDKLTIKVDDLEETIQFNSPSFVNIASATLIEIVTVVNNISELVYCRISDDDRFLILQPQKWDAEKIQVVDPSSPQDEEIDANQAIQFPVDEKFALKLYKNNILMKSREKQAELYTTITPTWNITDGQYLTISVDGTSPQTASFYGTDFPGGSFATATSQDWANVFNSKFAGIITSVTDLGALIIKSNRTGSSSSLNIIAGNCMQIMFVNMPTYSEGQDIDYILNRQSGNIQMISDIDPGDYISAGLYDVKGQVLSNVASNGKFDLSVDANGRKSEFIIVPDSIKCDKKSVGISVGDVVTITNEGDDTMRITSETSLSAFYSLQPGDYIYIGYRSIPAFIDIKNCGVFRIFAKGSHITAGPGGDCWIDVKNVDIFPQTATATESNDIQAFSCIGAIPQLWSADFTSPPNSVDSTLNMIAESINNKLINIKTEVYKTNSLRITSTLDANSGTIAIPVVYGSATAMMVPTTSINTNYTPHVANQQTSIDLFSYFKRGPIITDNIFYDRHIYGGIGGFIDVSVEPGVEGSDLYAELLSSSGVLKPSVISYSDIINMVKGSNQDVYKSIKNMFIGDYVGTQFDNIRTIMDYSGYNNFDEFNMVKPLSFSDSDIFTATLDLDNQQKRVDINMSRLAKVNSGSAGVFDPNLTPVSFSADDLDNEVGINFSKPYVWGKTITNAEFKDYAAWFRARNIYRATGGDFIVRSYNYGPIGEKIRFQIDYPTAPNLDQKVVYDVTPEHTLFTYYFGSEVQTASVANATSFAVELLSAPDRFYKLTFSSPVTGPSNGEIINLIYQDYLGNPYTGSYLIINILSPTEIVVRAHDGIPTTGLGVQEITDIQCIDDYQGDFNITNVDFTGLTGATINGKYFILEQKILGVSKLAKFWYDGTGSTPEPTSTETPLDLTIKISVLAGDDATTIAAKTSIVVDPWTQYNVTSFGPVMTMANAQNGLITFTADGIDAPTGASFTTVQPGIDPVTLDGKYFIIYDSNGSVKVYYEVDFSGVPEPGPAANTVITVHIVGNELAADVAIKTEAQLSTVADFTVSTLGDVITVENINPGSRGIGTAGTTGFTYNVTQSGSNPLDNITSSICYIYPLSSTSISGIEPFVNSFDVINITTVNDGNLTIATKDETSIVGLGHDPAATDGTNTYVKLFDGIGHIETFANTDPNFTLKTQFVLTGYDTAIYQIDTCPNSGYTQTGEFFKLIPITPHNLIHHLTHKAISQLPIISNVSISNNRKKLQITSKSAGSDGAVAVGKNTANGVSFYVREDGSEYTTGSGAKYLETQINSFPNTLSIGDYVKIYSDDGIPRLSRLKGTDEIEVKVESGTLDKFMYKYKHKIGFTNTDEVEISDVSSSYDMGTISRASGTIWRWTFKNTNLSVLSEVNIGDVLIPVGFSTLTLGDWDATNTKYEIGEDKVAGFPIIAIGDASPHSYVDVINPKGKAMAPFAAIGLNRYILISPTPVLKFGPQHAGRKFITSLSWTGSTADVAFDAPHNLNVGDFITIYENAWDAAEVATVDEVSSINDIKISFTTPPSVPSPVPYGFAIYDTLPANLTKYIIRKLGTNNLTELKWVGGTQRPYFASCGVAVDDFVVISGNTFDVNNNGRFVVRGVTEDSIIYENENTIDNLNTIEKFNNRELNTTWINNSATITGIAGTFKNLDLSGGWVKKINDPDENYCSIIGSDTGFAENATIIYLSRPYPGISGFDMGVYYNQEIYYGTGRILNSESDIIFYESDSTFQGDSLYIPFYSDVTWFSNGNTGTFDIDSTGCILNIAGDAVENYIKVTNINGKDEVVPLSYNPTSFVIYEGIDNKYTSLRVVENIGPNFNNSERSMLYLSPASKPGKFLVTYRTKIEPLGKINFPTTTSVGTDGYSYYTGLLRKTQRLVDGYAPDYDNYPGKKAIGSVIETMPPLFQRIQLSLEISTKFGVNIVDIKDTIKSEVVTHINKNLGVGTNVILSDIICVVKNVRGVESVKVILPTPSDNNGNPWIPISYNEKAYIDANDISIN